MKTKTQQGRAREIALSELRRMTPLFLAANALAIVISALYMVFGEGDFRLFTGLAAGNVVSAANFYLLGVTAEKSLRRKAEHKVRFSANMWYGIRYAGLFAVLAVLLAAKAVNIITLFFPLLLPRFHYFLLGVRSLRGNSKHSHSDTIDYNEI